MNIGTSGKNLIKHYEGCKLTAYLCPAGIWTIGYGSTAGVKPGQRITQAQADALFDKEIQKYAAGVSKYIKVTLNQNQFDALVSFAYNLGVGALQKSDLLKYVNQKDFVRAAAEFDKWNKAKVDGKLTVLQGLVNRRAEERKLFSTPVSSTKSKPTPTPKKQTTHDDTKLYRLVTGDFGNKENLEDAKKKLKEKYSWTVYEKIDTAYRLVTGTFKDQTTVNELADELKKQFGWTVYVKQE